MKNKGFTLVELLAMLVVLGILMGIAIPNIMGMVSNQRQNAIRNDATQMVSNAKVKIAKSGNAITKPTANKCVIFSLEFLNYNDNINRGPNGGDYEKYESFVIYTRVNNEYKYYVRLLEKQGNNKHYGVNLVESSELRETNTNDIKVINNATYGLIENNMEENKNILNSTSDIKSSICKNGVISYY